VSREPVTRYRFGDFVLSRRRRLLLRQGREQPLIPRYFDLLVFLIEHRADAVHRRDIFDGVWSDVVVSDSALTQAIRTIRRVLGDDSRESRFVRTVSRHGYQFVCTDLVEESDDGDWPDLAVVASPTMGVDAARSSSDLLGRLREPAADAGGEEEQRDAAERLHALGTEEALRLIGSDPNAAFARALLRDTRWDTPLAGDVPILGQPHAAATAWHLARLRFRRLAAIAANRWAAAALGCGVAGAIGGAVGGLVLFVAPGSTSSLPVVPVLALVGALCGAVAGAGVGAGIAVAESVIRSHRSVALAAAGAAGGGALGLAIQLLGAWTLEVLVGIAPPIGGGVQGAIIGLAAGLGYGAATRSDVGLAAPRGAMRARTAAFTAACTALAALVLSLAGFPIVGGTLHAIAQAATGGHQLLTPLGRLIGEPDFGPISAALIATGEGAAFGLGLALGLTRRQ
jgi:DNA-binding winged helix-turn-helix (wHTH) protein